MQVGEADGGPRHPAAYHILPLLCLGLSPVWAATDPSRPAPPRPAPPVDQRIERIDVQDTGARIQELRVGGETQTITVQPSNGMLNLEKYMTSINTQLKTASVSTLLPEALPKPEEKSTITDSNTLQLSKTTLTLSDEEISKKSEESSIPTEGFGDHKPFTVLKYKSSEERDAISLKEALEFSSGPKFSADAALTKLNKEMVSLQKRIEILRPNMLGKKWDFVLKDNKIEVTGSNLKEKDKQWLENTLNRNKTVLGAAKDFYAAVEKNYEHTREHPSASAVVNNKNVFAYGVAEQINGKIPLRSTMDKITAMHTNDIGQRANPFMEGMEVSLAYIKTSYEPTYFLENADMADPETAAWVQANPGKRF